jgi:hypothetical protein
LTEGRTYAQAAGLALDPFVGLAWSLVLVFLLLLGAAVQRRHRREPRLARKRGMATKCVKQIKLCNPVIDLVSDP